MMVQKSQNTVYVYIMEKATNRIKVWNSCEIYPASECDLDYYAEHKKSYFEAVTTVLQPYSYDIYRGYNVHSLHSQNLMGDFVLLNDILKYYK